MQIPICHGGSAGGVAALAVVFAWLQRYLVRGLGLGAVKQA
jgi:ABC-type maltose transport system permease subunit